MQLTQQQQEKLTVAIQAALGVIVIGLTVRNCAQVQNAQMKKAAKRQAKNNIRLQKQDYFFRRRLAKQRYRRKLKNVRRAGKTASALLAKFS